MLSILVSCSQDDISDSNNHRFNPLTDESIYNLIDEYYRESLDDTRSAKSFRIKNVTRERYSVTDPDSSGTNTRSDGLEDSFEMQTVALDFGTSEGYAIVSDDPRLNQVFMLTEMGSINDTTYIKPLKDLINTFPDVASNIIVQNSKQGSSGMISRSEPGMLVNSLVRFKWGQHVPFNNYAKYCTCEKCKNKGNHMPIGCVTIAVGQTIATLGKFNGTFYGTKDIAFNSLPVYGYQMTSDQKLQIAHFLQEIALNCQIKFDCDGSSTYAKPVYNYLTDLGYDCTYKEGAIDEARTLELLKKGIPHLIGGVSSGNGHMWIIHGMKVNNGRYHYLCNWGWDGSSNGWSIGDPYSIEGTNIEYSKNLKHIYINSKI